MPVWERARRGDWIPTRAQRLIMSRNAALNEALYGLCDQYPDHSDRAATRAKVVIIGRTYATGLERHVESVDDVGAVLYKARSWLDVGTSGLRSKRDHEPAVERIHRIALLHARVQRALGAITRNGNSVRSFVSKYLHFHAPVVPIFDHYASAAMASWYRWPPKHEVGTRPARADESYWRHLVRSAFVVDEWRRLGIASPTARAIDSYAIAWWETRGDQP